jgi:proteasome alpha subunit
VSDEHGYVAIGGHAEELTDALRGAFQEGWDLSTAVREGVRAISSAENRQLEPGSIEAGTLDRTRPQRRKFRRLDDEEVARILSG